MTDNHTTLLALMLVDGTGRRAIANARIAANHIAQPLHALLGRPLDQLAAEAPAGVEGGLEALARCTDRYIERAAQLLEQVAALGGTVFSTDDQSYPPCVKACLGRQVPPLLFVLGPPLLLQAASAGIVGARRCTATGARLAQECAGLFARQEIPVVSGGAVGIDSTAHAAALECGGTTVVVLPQGLLTYHLSLGLIHALADDSAAVVSEFVPDDPWSTHGAVTRNATVCALADLICVIEPRKTGGSVRTARLALELGKPVFVYCAEGPDSPAATLARAGALDLLGSDGCVDSERLWTLWRHPPKPPSQGALF